MTVIWHVGIHWKAFAEYYQMIFHIPGFQSFSNFFQIILLCPNKPPAGRGLRSIINHTERSNEYHQICEGPVSLIFFFYCSYKVSLIPQHKIDTMDTIGLEVNNKNSLLVLKYRQYVDAIMHCIVHSLVLPALLLRQSSLLTSNKTTTSMPLPGSAGGGCGRGSGASVDFFLLFFSRFSLVFSVARLPS